MYKQYKNWKCAQKQNKTEGNKEHLMKEQRRIIKWVNKPKKERLGWYDE